MARDGETERFSLPETRIVVLYVYGVPKDVSAKGVAVAFQEWANDDPDYRERGWFALDVTHVPPREEVD